MEDRSGINAEGVHRLSAQAQIERFIDRHVINGNEILKLSHAYLTTDDPESLAKFYEALGMTIRFADPGKWIQFAGDKSAFCIAAPIEPASGSSRDAVLVFEVEDLEATVARARVVSCSASLMVWWHSI